MLKKLSIVLGAVALVAVGYTAVDIVAPDQTAMAPLVGSAFAGQGQFKRWALHLDKKGRERCVKVTGAGPGSSCWNHDTKHEEDIYSNRACTSSASCIGG